MVDFRSPALEDKGWIEERINKVDFPTCEYTFGSIFCYTEKMDIRVADVYGFLVTKCFFRENFVEYCFPAGEGDLKKAIEFIIEDGKSNGIPFGIFGMNEDNARFLKENFGDMFDVHFERDLCDYFYLSEDLINLKGRRYQPKRNLISQFIKNNNWSYERITDENIHDCLEMSRLWLQSSKSEHREDLEYEFRIISKAFENYNELGYVGGLLRADGKVVAYTMGERLSAESFCVHFEKAFADIKGAYPTINQQFVKNELSGYKYIDREDDAGIENLRKAKLSYHPVIIADKYEAEYKEC